MAEKTFVREGIYFNDHHRLRVALLRSSYWIRGLYKRFFDRYDLTQQQFNVLSVVHYHHPEQLSTKKISEGMLDTYADTSRIVDRLVAKELLKKNIDAHDRRLIRVRLTAPGTKLVESIYDAFEQQDQWTAELSAQEEQQLLLLLKKMMRI